MSDSSDSITKILPLEVIDRAIGKQITVLMQNDKEFSGTLIGFDDFVNMVMVNVQEVDNTGSKGEPIKKMLLNGGHISMIIPQL